MLISTNDVYQSTLLSGIPGLVHGYSTRSSGDAREAGNARAIVRRLTDKDMPLVRGQQIHGNAIAVVDASSPRSISGVDGLVSQSADILLEVHVADCVPVLLVDPEARIVSVVHAGWKGTVSHITRNALNRMIELGATPSRIRASIGPHIGRCCYTVPEDRAAEFLAAFGSDSNITVKEGNTWRLDLGSANRSELLQAGVTPDHIDSPVVCTSCQVDTFYSYRKDSSETFGEIIGVIGFT